MAQIFANAIIRLAILLMGNVPGDQVVVRKININEIIGVLLTAFLNHRTWLAICWSITRFRHLLMVSAG